MRTLRAMLALTLIVGFAALAQSGGQSMQQGIANREAEPGIVGAGDGGMMRHHVRHMGDGGMMHHRRGRHAADAGM